MKQFGLLFVLFLFSGALSAQSLATAAQSNPHKLRYRFSYIGQYKLSPKWGIHTDVQFRMDENLKFSQQNVLRLGPMRFLTPKISVAAGYAHFKTFNTTFRDYNTEHRSWEQFFYGNKVRRRTHLFRFRLEQRFVEKLALDRNGEVRGAGYSYGNRMRFFNRVIFDLTKNPEAKNIFYFALQDEFFLNVAAREVNRNFFDQNRFLVVFGIQKDKHTRLETGYVNLFFNPYQRPNVKSNSLHFSIIQTLNFGAAE